MKSHDWKAIILVSIIILYVGYILFFPMPCQASPSSAEVLLQFVDQYGMAIPGVEIILFNEEAKINVAGKSNEYGEYKFTIDNLSSANQKVSITTDKQNEVYTCIDPKSIVLFRDAKTKYIVTLAKKVRVDFKADIAINHQPQSDYTSIVVTRLDNGEQWTFSNTSFLTKYFDPEQMGLVQVQATYHNQIKAATIDFRAKLSLISIPFIFNIITPLTNSDNENQKAKQDSALLGVLTVVTLDRKHWLVRPDTALLKAKVRIANLSFSYIKLDGKYHEVDFKVSNRASIFRVSLPAQIDIKQNYELVCNLATMSAELYSGDKISGNKIQTCNILQINNVK